MLAKSDNSLKKICIDCRMINSSGIGTYIRNIIPEVIHELNDVKFYLLGDKSKILNSNLFNFSNIEIIEFEAPIYSIKEQIIYPFIIPKDVQLFWSIHYNFPVFYKGNLLVTIMDVAHLALDEFNSSIIKSFYANFMFKQIASRANSLIYISEFSKKQFNEYVGKPFGNEFVTLLGVGNGWFNTPEENLDILSQPYILSVGNVKPHKNLGRLIDAFKKISHKIKHKLVIVGKDEGFITGDNTLKDKIKGLDERIIFTGEVGEFELKKYFRNADIFVFPSLYEGFGLPPLEAMASGLPVISSPNASLTEVCGDAAIYFNPNSTEDLAEKLFNIIIDKELRNTHIVRGIRRAKKFTWRRARRQTINIIKEEYLKKT